MPRFSANLSYLFTEEPFLDRFGLAARAGFAAVEFGQAYEYPAADIAEAVRESRVEVVLINAPAGDWDGGERGTASLSGREDEFAAGFVTALRYARALRCTRVHVLAGIVPPIADPAEAAHRRALQRTVLLGNLRFACQEAAEAGVTVLLEALNPFDVPNYFYSRQADVHAIRREIGAANLKVQMDLYHTQRTEGALTENLERWMPDIGHIQIAGVPGRHEPDAGEINYRYVFEVLDRLGYAGWVGCEYRPAATTVSGLGWRERLLRR